MAGGALAEDESRLSCGIVPVLEAVVWRAFSPRFAGGLGWYVVAPLALSEAVASGALWREGGSSLSS